jgi:(p)ppGpp synthase/HD superfamily hydrolase
MHSYAQSIHHLYLQLIRAGYSEDELLKVKATYGLACDLFAGTMTASGKPHISHGIGTASILASLGAPPHVVLAGMIHNAYGMGDFGDNLKGPTEQRRNEVRKITGQQAEQCIERFHQTRPWTREMIEQMSNQFEDLDETGRDTLQIRLADDLEHHLDYGLVYRVNGVMLKRARERRDYTLLVAKQLHLPQLEAEFYRVFAEIDSDEVPAVLYEDLQAPLQLIPRALR